MKGLANLIRLHKLKLTEQQRKLNALQAVAQGFLSQIQTLDQTARSEADSAGANPDTAHMLGSFVQSSIARRRTLQGSLAEIEHEMAAIRSEVATAFSELKRYQLLEERRQKEEKRSLRKRERHTEDEVGMSIYRQKKTAAGA